MICLTNIHVSSHSFSSEAQGKGVVDIEPNLILAQKEPVDALGAQADIAPTGEHIAWLVGCVSDADCHRWVQAPKDTEAKVQSSIAVCECTLASQRYGA